MIFFEGFLLVARAEDFLWKGFCLMIFWEDFLVVGGTGLCTELKDFGLLAKGCYWKVFSGVIWA